MRVAAVVFVKKGVGLDNVAETERGRPPLPEPNRGVLGAEIYPSAQMLTFSVVIGANRIYTVIMSDTKSQ